MFWHLSVYLSTLSGGGGVPGLRFGGGGVPSLSKGKNFWHQIWLDTCSDWGKKILSRDPPPPPSAIARNCYGYAAGGMPLAFTQEDFLVILSCRSFYISEGDGGDGGLPKMYWECFQRCTGDGVSQSEPANTALGLWEGPARNDDHGAGNGGRRWFAAFYWKTFLLKSLNPEPQSVWELIRQS